MEQDPEELDSVPPAGSYLVFAGIPAGLLLWLGMAWVLKHAPEAPWWMPVLKWLGLGLALFSALAFIKGLLSKDISARN